MLWDAVIITPHRNVGIGGKNVSGIIQSLFLFEKAPNTETEVRPKDKLGTLVTPVTDVWQSKGGTDSRYVLGFENGGVALRQVSVSFAFC